MCSMYFAANMFDCVQDVFLNKTSKNALLPVVIRGQGEGSLIFMLRQGFPSALVVPPVFTTFQNLNISCIYS